MSARPKVLLIVSGGIAAYKAPALVRALVKTGHDVAVIATAAALSFTTALSLSTVSGRPVRTSLLDPAEEGSVGHIELADWPDIVLVAPATADLMAKAAHGLAGDLASTVLLATQAPVLWAPAMNTNMWRHPATVANLQALSDRGAHFVGPDAGELACGWVGEGRMIDPDIIAARVRSLLQDDDAASWAGKRVLVSAGPTRAYLDPVRFFSNASTGAMGFAIAQVAAARGAQVVLVAGPVALQTPPGVERHSVETAEEMLEAMDAQLGLGDVDLVAMVAAVSDLRASAPSGEKLPKSSVSAALAQGLLVEGVDVLATLTAKHRGSSTHFLGFGAQTVREPTDDAAVRDALVSAGRAKLHNKGAQSIFVNRVGVPGVGFGSDTNTGVLLLDAGREVRFAGPTQPKPALAGWILDQLASEVCA
ncbi:MAG: bifunctional phosphopantothenoylcysteine decarboxylase/phosphopantothenate--cysteine ligase CoaBC [Nannocystaceae bacterium]|nr:bifunctional phosphopantothenoylcysteine decarboxylase/phosphopantothenate--cysteine ligase CoaBC [bacterium]